MKRVEVELSKKEIRLSELEMRKWNTGRKHYEEQQSKLQLDLLRLQHAARRTNRRIMVVLEGWDAAGKGGVIRRLTEKLDPRAVRVWPIGAPEKTSQARHYLLRFWEKLPDPGTIAIFDRSWYGRVLVERVEGFAQKPEWKRAYDEINEFEHLLISDGIQIIKVFLHIDKDEQLKRFAERLNNPYKHWKIGPDDLRNRERWDEYVEAIEDMFDKTNTKAAPWEVIGANDKHLARITVLKLLRDAMDEELDPLTRYHSEEFRKEAFHKLGLGDPPPFDPSATNDD